MLLSAQSLTRTALDLELIILCESLGSVAAVWSIDLSRGFSDLAFIVSWIQLIGVSALLLTWFFTVRPIYDLRILHASSNICLLLACGSLLTSSTHMTHLSSALLFATAKASVTQENARQ